MPGSGLGTAPVRTVGFPAIRVPDPRSVFPTRGCFCFPGSGSPRVFFPPCVQAKPWDLGVFHPAGSVVRAGVRWPGQGPRNLCSGVSLPPRGTVLSWRTSDASLPAGDSVAPPRPHGKLRVHRLQSRSLCSPGTVSVAVRFMLAWPLPIRKVRLALTLSTLAHAGGLGDLRGAHQTVRVPETPHMRRRDPPLPQRTVPRCCGGSLSWPQRQLLFLWPASRGCRRIRARESTMVFSGAGRLWKGRTLGQRKGQLERSRRGDTGTGSENP